MMNESAETFPFCIDDCYDLVQEVAPDGILLRVNRAWRETLGYDADEIPKLRLFDIVHPDSVGRCRAHFARIIEGEHVTDMETQIRTKEGRYITVVGSCRCVRDKDDTASCFGIFHDITKRKEAEEELKRREAELDQRVRDRTARLMKLNEALKTETRKMASLSEELERSNKELEQFAFVVAHDLSAPLQAMTGFAGILEQQSEGQLDEETGHCVREIVEGGGRMRQMLDGLLEYSRVGTSDHEYDTPNGEEILQRALDNLRVDIEQSEAVITYDSLPMVKANPAQMLRLLQNLIQNAIRYCGNDRPRIHVGVTQNELEFEFTVRDNGIGVDSKDVDRIFKIFERGPSSNSEGTGIGLAICKRIVLRHHGRIWCTQNRDAGTTFHFTLPQA